MSFILDTFARAAFKRLVGKAHTSDTRDPANEPIASNFTLSAQTIWASKINPTPASSANTGIVSELVTLTLEPVSGTANTGKYSSYRSKLGAAVPTSLVGKINRQTGSMYTAGDYVGDIIPTSFGDSFRPKLFKGAVETPLLDASDWFLDASSGVITQEEDAPASMIDYSTTGTLQCYIYIGDFVSDAIAAGATVFYDYQTIGAGITGVLDGINDVLTLDHVPSPGSVHLFLNGILTRDFVVSGADVILGSTSLAFIKNDPSTVELYVNYRQ